MFFFISIFFSSNPILYKCQKIDRSKTAKYFINNDVTRRKSANLQMEDYRVSALLL